jgi:hypothetical protein
MIVIPVPTAEHVDDAQPFWSMRVRLDGAEFVLDAVWNQRAGKWYMGLSDGEGNRLAGQQKVTCHVPLFRLVTSPVMFLGRLFALDTSAADPSTEGRDPHLLDFGTRVLLVYAAESEL